MTNTTDPTNRLFELLPIVYQQRDAEQGWPLRSLLQVIGDQVEVVRADIGNLYDNWFIETCDDWVVPYIGALVGYRPVHEAGDPGDITSTAGRRRNRILIPRREVVNTIRYRRRKGTYAVLAELALGVAGWPALVVEFYRLLGVTQAINALRLDRGRTVDLHDGDALNRLGTAIDGVAHTVEVRRPDSHQTPGRFNIPSVGVFAFRLRPYSITRAPAFVHEDVGPYAFTFSALGNDMPLFTWPQAEGPGITAELTVPLPIRRRAMQARVADYFGAGESVMIWTGTPRMPLSASQLVVADLTNWRYRATNGTVVIDPELGRIAFPPAELPKGGVSVSYRYGFSADLGGGEYDRPIRQPADAKLYRVGPGQAFSRLADALAAWQADRPPHAVIEITDSGVYVEPVSIALGDNQALQLRAANRTRPVIQLVDWHTEIPNSLKVTGAAGSCFILDGVLVTGRAVHVEGDLAELTIRHCTLVPGWGLEHDCQPLRPADPSLELYGTRARVNIEHSIVGAIEIDPGLSRHDPIEIVVTDTILDATSKDRVAVGAPQWPVAQVVLTVVRSTVFGQLQVHALELGEDSLFMGMIQVARRQRGCMRFSSVVTGSRTPRRYECQPDLIDQAIADEVTAGTVSQADQIAFRDRERLRVVPQFNSVRYGTPAYGQLALETANEIRRGAEDGAEMGAFHDLYQPQREANLLERLEEFVPAAMDAGVIFAT
jgi:hypothetical protein